MLFLFSLHTKSILVALLHYGLTTDVTWSILTMSLLPLECGGSVAVNASSERSLISLKIS